MSLELVKQLMPETEFYGDGYDHHGLFGGEARTVMAHCVYSTDEEVERIRKNGVWVAHCPNSNMNLASGIAPIRRYLEAGIRVGLGSDVAGGQTESMFRAITDAIQVSKLLWRYLDPSARSLCLLRTASIWPPREEALSLGRWGALRKTTSSTRW